MLRSIDIDRKRFHACRGGLAFLAAASFLIATCLPSLAKEHRARGEAKSPAAAATSAPRATERVAIAAFAAPEQSDPAKWHPLGDELSDMLITAMAQRGVDVMERANLPALEAEQQLLAAGVLEHGAVPAGGRKLGAQILVAGRISEFGVKTQTSGISGIMNRVLPNTSIHQVDARVKLDARLVDATTGRVVAVATGEGSEKSADFSLGQGGVLGWLGSVSFASDDWLESKLGRAARKAVEQLADKLVPRIPAAGPEDAQPQAGVESAALDIAGFKKLSEANDFLTALRRLSGITKAELREWRDGVLFAMVEGDRDSMRQLAIRLETEADLKSFDIAVETSVAGKIGGGAHGFQRAPTPPQPEQPAKQ